MGFVAEDRFKHNWILGLPRTHRLPHHLPSVPVLEHRLPERLDVLRKTWQLGDPCSMAHYYMLRARLSHRKTLDRIHRWWWINGDVSERSVCKFCAHHLVKSLEYSQRRGYLLPVVLYRMKTLLHGHEPVLARVSESPILVKPFDRSFSAIPASVRLASRVP